ncbi:MAG: hypothetical protein CSB55_01730 [Candidatus Cloacimonadota bacterium]|nr:MAG: hypothetical protein CSB55_01730 [Candidatus Cloacimonadota bacterium]
MRRDAGFSIYKLITFIAVIAMIFVLSLPQFFNINEKENEEQCLKNMKLIYKAIKAYMDDRNEEFVGDAQDLIRAGYLKKTFECPENGVGDKYFMEGLIDNGKFIITVKCPNSKDHPNHILPDIQE